MFMRLVAFCVGVLSVVNTFSALNVELSVKECAGVGSDGYPIRTVVPLPKGIYQNTNSFRLTDASGVTVPAQFEVLSRRYIGDQSITNIAVTYLPTVSSFTGAGTGTTKYYLKDDGTGTPPSSTLSVEQTNDLITVTTGNSLKFTVKKSGFNILNEVWYDPTNGGNFGSANLVVKPNANSGGEFIGRLNGDLQLDADRSDIKVEVEEVGPVAVVIRAEAVTKYTSPSDHTHGWAVRIYAYAGKSHIKVDYQLQNSSKTKKYSWPLYFHALNLNFDLNLAGTVSVKSGLGNGTVHSTTLGTGVMLGQLHDTLFNIYRADGAGDTTTVLGTGGRPDGFITLDNGTVGVTVKTRHFWQMYPNGIKVDQNQKLSVQLFPEWSCQIHGAKRNPTFSPTHLYWLADMQHVYKEVVLNFHQSSSDNELLKFSKTVDYHPVASLPVSYVGSAGASLDLEGLIPFTSKISTTDSRIPANPSAANLGWYFFVLNGRRTNTAAAGGYPQGGGQFWASENPADWFVAEREAIGEMNIRPQWMAQYNFATDFSLLKLGMNNGTASPSFSPMSLRDQNMGAGVMDSAILAETASGYYPIGYSTSIDNAHYWHHHMKDYYWITGNYWQKDYYKFIVEFRKNLTVGFPTIARHGGHPLADALQALYVTGDTVMERLLKENMLTNRARVRPQFGDYNTMCCGEFGTAPWEMGFGARPVIDYLTQISERDLQMQAESFQLISAYLHWNLHYGNFGYRAYSPQVQNSYIGSFTVLDPQAWYYWNTGKRVFLDHAMTYINTGITVPNGEGSTGKPMTADGSSNWTGAYAGRWIQFVRNNTRSDTTPPAAIQDAVMERSGTNCTVRWTVPVDAKRYHIVWGTKPLVYNQTDDLKYLNWWAANTVGKSLTAAAGTQDQVAFTVPSSGLVFAAVFTFDSASNMSGFSNVATSDLTQATAPSNLTATVVNAQKVSLSWGASSDPESGIWYYNVYRNGVLISTTDKLVFEDDGLTESTSYSYAVAAVSGSNVEGVRAEASSINTPADTEAPFPVGAVSVSTDAVVTVTFSEALESASAQNIANYSLSNGVTVSGAVLQSDNKTVILTCSPMQYQTSYTLTVNGVRDRATTPNSVSNATISFIHREPLLITNTRPTEYVWTQFTTDVDVFIDQSTKMTSIPPEYENLPLLRCGSMYSKYYARNDSIIAFTSNKALKVYLMMDRSQTARPTWLTSRFTPNGDTISNFVVWETTYSAGRVQIPGGNLSEAYSNYFIVVEPLDSSWVIASENSSNSEELVDGLTASPNPFNPSISITFQLGTVDKSYGQLLPPMALIFDATGRVVEKIMPEAIGVVGNGRKYSFNWNANGQASGVYFVHVKAQNREFKKRIVLTK